MVVESKEIKENWAGLRRLNIYFCVVLAAMTKFYFWKKYWAVGSTSNQLFFNTS